MRILRLGDYRAVPWKNGQGTTREILRHPTDAGDFAWRLSLAEVGQSGPFSAFPGYERIIVLLAGDGFVLRFAEGAEHALRVPHAPYRFDGGAEVACVLDGGSSSDLNLMVRADLSPARCEVVSFTGRRELAPAPGAARLIFCLSAGFAVREGEAGGGQAHEIGPWDTVVFDPAESGRAGILCRSNGPAEFFHALIADAADSR